VIVSHSGPGAWASIAVGQAVGTSFGVLVGFGWGTTGPTQIAMADGESRVRIYFESLRARAFLAVPGILASVLLATLITHSYQVEAAITAAAFTLTGLLAGWFFTGSARPYAFLALDTLPRVLGTAGGVLAILMGADLFVFPASQLIGILLGIVLSAGSIYDWSASKPNSFRRSTGKSRQSVVQLLRSQSHGMVIAGVSAAYIGIPISIVAIAAPSALPAYALADKLLRFATTAFAPVIQFLQGWVPGPDLRLVRDRVRIAFSLGLASTVAAGVIFAISLPWLSTQLGRGQIVLSPQLSAAFGLILALLVMAQIAGLVCLLALGRAQRLAIFTVIGVTVALPLVFLGATLFGAEGAAWGIAVAESIALTPQVILLARLRPVSSASAHRH
jgi:hypothetical protein